MKDAGGNPVSGAVVTFAAPATGASGSFAGGVVTATTNAAGVATSATFTANTTIGSYAVTASSGAATGASFALTNIPGNAASITATGGTNDSAPINTLFGARLVATVKDLGGNPVSGVTVTFSAPGTGASGAFAGGVVTATTDTTGAATAAAFTANGTAGSYSVTATVTGVATPATFALTNTQGAPASVTVATTNSGNNQSAQINTAFALPLKVVVKDAGNNLLSGITVTFTPPASGASGVFTTSNTAVTDVTGTATSNIYTANATFGLGYTIAATVNGVAAPANFTMNNTAGPAASIAATGGTPQSATIGSTFTTALSATVKDASNNPVSGVVVTFAAPGTGASGTFAGSLLTATTNASGVATSATFTANTTSGTYNVTASVTGVATPASFALTNNAGAAASIAATGGTPQSAGIGAAFATNLSATVRDASNNLVSGVVVTFAAPATGASGTFAAGGNTATTNASGVATAGVFTANNTKGAYSVTASVPGVATPATFALTNQTGNPASISATSGITQTTQISTQFGSALVATVLDAGSNPVSGASVTFTAPSTGASGTFAGGSATYTIATDANGKATSALFTANSTVGANYIVTATVTGVATPANFTLSNTVGSPASITATAGTPQSAQVGTAFANVLKALVKDSGGNVVPGAVVTFNAPATGASGTFTGGVTTATTDGTGTATSAIFVANGTIGAYSVTATSGTATAGTFALTNTPGNPASIATVAGTPQSIGINTAFGSPLQALVKDASGNAVSGAVVTFTAPTSGASGSFAGGVNTATTNGSGMASSPVFTANAITGSYSVTATVTGVATGATFALTNTPGAASTVTFVSGAPQTTAVLTAFTNPLKALVKDIAGNLVSGAVVTFTAPASGASATFAGGVNTAISDATGTVTSPAVSAGATVGGPYNVIASVPSGTASATFALTNTVGAAAKVLVNSGSGQFASINTAYGSFLSATVQDAGGNPVSGQLVTFTAPATSSGASGTFVGGVSATTATTGANGIATTTVAFTADSTMGTFNVTATTGSATSALFAMTNIAGAAATVAANSGSGQFATVATAYAAPLTAIVKDSSGNPVSGVNVTFTVQGSLATFPGSVNSATAPTNAQGIATSPTITASTAAGTVGILAQVTGLTSANFILTNTAGAPFQITATSGNSQSAIVGESFTALVATVKDSFGNLVSGASVTFTAPSSNPTAKFVGSSTYTTSTASNGQAKSAAPVATGTTGAYIVTATAACTGCSANFNLNNITGGNSGQITVTNVTVGQNLEAAIMVTVPSNPSGVSITLSCDATKVVIGNSNVAGSCTPQAVALSAGQTFFTTFVQALQSSGTTAITASATGWLTGVGTVTMTPSGFVLAGPGGSSAIGQSFIANAGVNAALTVYPAQLDASGNFVATGQLRGGYNTSVTVTSQTQSVGTITAGTVSMTGGSTSGTSGLHPIATGSTLLQVAASAPFMTPLQDASLTATVNASALSLQSVSVGKNLEATSIASINAAATDDGLDPNHPGVHITVTSTDPSLKFSLTGTDAGSTSITVLIPILQGVGLTQSQPFYVYGNTSQANGLGTVTFTGTNPNFSTGSATATVTPSGFLIGGTSGLGGSFPSSQGFPETINVYPFQLDALATLNPVQQQALAGSVGASISVGINNPNTNIGTLASSSVTIGAGSLVGQTTFNAGSTPGEDDLTVIQPAGFSTPSVDTMVSAIVSLPGIAINDGGSVGNQLQTSGNLGIGTAQASDLVITLTSLNYPTLKLSNNGTDGGFQSIQVTIPALSTQSPSYFIYGFADSGSAQYTASATGFNSRTSTISFTPSGVVILGTFTQFRQDTLNTSVSAGPSPFTVEVGQLASDGSFIGQQALAGGVSPLFLTLTDLNPAAGAGTFDSFFILNPATSVAVGSNCAPGAVNCSGTFVPTGVNQSTMIQLNEPGNFTLPSDYQVMTVNVNP